MALLSTGQRLAIEHGKNLDGGPSSKQYVNLVKKNVRVKILEACADLQELYEKFPEYKSTIENSLRWFHSSPRSPKQVESKSGDAAEPEFFPDDLDPSKGEKYEPDVSKAFKGLNL